MKTTLKIFSLFLVVVLISISTTESQATKTKTKWSVETGKSFIRQFPDPDVIYCCGNTNHFSWQAGYVLFSMEKMWHLTGDPLYFNYIKRYADQQVDEKGTICCFSDDALDNFLPGYALLFMYEQTGLEKYKIAAMKIRKAFDTYPRNSNGLFWHGQWAKNQVWVDGLFMGQIFLLRYGKVIGDSEYAFNEAVKQITLAAEICQLENGLLLHGWDESKKASWANKSTGLAAEVWSEGLGWYAVLMADVFDYLPANHPAYNTLAGIHRKLCYGLKEVQDQKTGMWFQVVGKPDAAGNWNETSGTAMFIYLIKKSINQKRIPRAEFQPVVEKAYSGLVTKIKRDKNGEIQLYDCSSIGIQDDYKAYITQPREVSTFAAFGSVLIGTSVMEFPMKHNKTQNR